MTKREFLAELKWRTSVMPSDDAAATLEYYSEIIDDRMEEGLSEEEAVAAVGSPADIAAEALGGMSLEKLVKETDRPKPKRTLRAWEIVLIVLGAPLWLSLLLAAVSIVIAVYISLWACVISLYAAEVAVLACAFAGVIAFPICFFAGNISTGVFLLGAGVLLAGIGIFGFYGCIALTKAMCRLCRVIFKGIISIFTKKEAVK
ncbi:MAG: DUF1700 domain-containing protein [Ruminococcaceae bacterium]|nr:DUF1700 domain-containing protein [Oscillospiraceae bacterium]